MLRILEISCVNGTHQISVRGVSADLRVVKYANTTLIWGSGTVKYRSRTSGQGARLKGMSRTITMQGFTFTAIIGVEKT